jgi:hypothetical protein
MKHSKHKLKIKIEDCQRHQKSTKENKKKKTYRRKKPQMYVVIEMDRRNRGSDKRSSHRNLLRNKLLENTKS